MDQNEVLNQMSTKFPKFFSVCELKIKYISHTKGHYGQRILDIKNSERKAQGGLKSTKLQKAQKVKKWHGNEEQMNISVYHIVQSYGVQAGSYPKTDVKNEIHIPGL